MLLLSTVLDLASQLYAHGLVRPFRRDGNRLPSGLPSRTFALVLQPVFAR